MRGTILKIRLLEYKDLETIYSWRVEPETIIWTKSKNKFSKATHIEWFKNRLESLKSNPMVILELSDLPIGYVRFDNQEQVNSRVMVKKSLVSKNLRLLGNPQF